MQMLGVCGFCCSDESLEDKVLVNAYPTDYTPRGLKANASPTDFRHPQLEEHDVASQPSVRSSYALPSHRMINQMSSEEKQREKARIQDVIRDFACRAIDGIGCEVVRDGERLKGRYTIDGKLQKLTLKVFGRSTPESIFVLRNVRNIWKPQENEAAFPADVLAAVASETDRRRLLAVEVGLPESCPEPRGERASMIFFLEATPEAREIFCTCMKVLRLSAPGTPMPPGGLP